VEEATEELGISRAFGYETVVRGEIPCVRSGGRILVANVGLERMLDG
jgi:excisionase family DNA binding protein